MSEEDITPEEIENIRKEDLENTTLDEIVRPRVFSKPTKENPNVSFDFILKSNNVKVIKDKPSKMGTSDLYILDTLPEIYTYRNAVIHLREFVKANGLKIPANLKYVTREGSDFDTSYIFEEVKPKK